MRIALLNSDYTNEYRMKHNKIGGVGYYRLWLPKLAIEECSDWVVDFIGTDFADMIDGTSQETIARSYIDFFNKYDAVIIKHFDNPNAGRFLSFASDYTGVPIITDLDDDVLSVREDQPAHKKGYSKGAVQRTTVATMLSYSKAIFTTNHYLGKKITKELKEIFNIDLPYFVLPNYNNKDEWKFKSKTNKDKVVIGWHGSLTHDSDLKLVLPHIKRLMEDNDNVYFELLGGVNTDFALENFKDWMHLIDRIELIPGTLAWHNFPYHLMKQKWDIGIAPLIDDEFNRSKSNIKWLEYSMKKIPCVASDVEPYRTIKNGIDGFLVKEDEWYDTLTKLVKDSKLRKKIGNNAHKEVVKNWQYKDKGQLWIDAISSVLKTNKKG